MQLMIEEFISYYRERYGAEIPAMAFAQTPGGTFQDEDVQGEWLTWQACCQAAQKRLDNRPHKTAEQVLADAGVFAGANGLRGLADCNEFWEQQPYSTRLYFSDKLATDYLHRGVLRSAIKALEAPAGVPAEALDSELQAQALEQAAQKIGDRSRQMRDECAEGALIAAEMCFESAQEIRRRALVSGQEYSKHLDECDAWKSVQKQIDRRVAQGCDVEQFALCSPGGDARQGGLVVYWHQNRIEGVSVVGRSAFNHSHVVNLNVGGPEPEAEAHNQCCCGETDQAWRLCPLHNNNF